MLFAVVARPAVYGGKVVSYDAAAALKVPGVVQVVEIPGTPAAFRSSSRSADRRRRAQHLGGDQGPRGPEDHLGRRSERNFDSTVTRPRWKNPRAPAARSFAISATSRPA